MNNTLEQLENEYWGEPECDSGLVSMCPQLRKKPVHDLTVEDLRVLIGQNIGVKHLLPLAMGVLRNNPLASGDCYEGDLLKATINCDDVQKNGDIHLQEELAGLCLKAATNGVDKEVKESFVWANAPEEYGVSHDTVETMRQVKTEEIKSEYPWCEFYEFYLRHTKR